MYSRLANRGQSPCGSVGTASERSVDRTMGTFYLPLAKYSLSTVQLGLPLPISPVLVFQATLCLDAGFSDACDGISLALDRKQEGCMPRHVPDGTAL